ncbi:hypothetical protein GALL_487240 [mine drainage metagenome]|uniref:Uncharacterized protein n=1 Tax=mine drainage metagenome TaxID=410659 RepID=A0A1J5PEM3_9ZZZZ
MNTDLRHFVTQIFSIVLGCLMLVSFFAFVSIPYSLGAHPGEARVAQQPLAAAGVQVAGVEPLAGNAVRL